MLDHRMPIKKETCLTLPVKKLKETKPEPLPPLIKLGSTPDQVDHLPLRRL